MLRKTTTAAVLSLFVLGGSSSGQEPSPVVDQPVRDYDQPPKPIKITRPRYPQKAFGLRIEGTVVVEILIDEKGRVSPRRILTSIPLLDAAALETVKEWVFTPAIKKGRPVATVAHAPMVFKIFPPSSGKPSAEEEAKAAALYKEACDGGSMKDCHSLGIVSLAGRGVAKDAVRAVALLNQACDGGYAAGCYILASEYANGVGVEKNPVTAADFYTKACDGGIASACRDLGVAYAKGEGVERNPVTAAELFQKACDGGFTPACKPPQ